MRLAPAIVLACAVLSPAWAAAPHVPQVVIATYDMSRNGVPVAVMHETFEAKDGAYRIVSESRAVGLLALFERQPLRFVSSGLVTATGLRPLQFEGKRSDADPRKVRGEFDWKTGQLTLAHAGRTDVLPLPGQTQDRLSVMYQFMFLAPLKTGQLPVAMTNGRKLGQYQYSVRPDVDIDTPIGRITAVHVVKQHRPDESGTEIWLSPQHRYLPVRMLVLEEDGVRYDQVITGIEFK